MPRWVVSLLSGFAALFLVPISGILLGHFHHQLPESVRSHLPLEQVQENVKNFGVPFLLTYLKDFSKRDNSEFQKIEIQKPDTGSSDDNDVAHKDFDWNARFGNIKDLKQCEAWDDMDVEQYEKYIDDIALELNLTDAEARKMKRARHTSGGVKGLEKFELNNNGDGLFYFGRFRTRRRANKNMDIAIVVYGFKWTLPSESEKDQETGKMKRLLQTIAPRQKEVWVKTFRSQAVQTFSDICPSELLSIVDKPRETKSTAETNNEEEEVDETKEMWAQFQKFLEKKAVPMRNKAN